MQFLLEDPKGLDLTKLNDNKISFQNDGMNVSLNFGKEHELFNLQFNEKNFHFNSQKNSGKVEIFYFKVNKKVKLIINNHVIHEEYGSGHVMLEYRTEDGIVICQNGFHGQYEKPREFEIGKEKMMKLSFVDE